MNKEHVEEAAKAIIESEYSDKKIAERMGISLQSVNRWRRMAVKSIRRSNLIRLGEALDGAFIFQSDGTVKFYYVGEKRSRGEGRLPSKDKLERFRDVNIPPDYNINDLKDEGLKELLTPIYKYGHRITRDEEYDLITISIKNETNATLTQWIVYLDAMRSLKGK